MRCVKVLCVLVLAAGLTAAVSGCASTAKKAGRAAATTTVQGAKTGAKVTATGAKAVGGATAGAVTRNR